MSAVALLREAPETEVALLRVPSAALRARRHPWTLAMLYAWESGLGLLLGSSVASVATAAYGHHPAGDSPLFAPGGLALLDLVRHSSAAGAPLLSGVFVLVVVARLGGLLPAALCQTQLAFATQTGAAPRLRDAAGRALRALPATFSIAMLALATEATVGLLGVVAGVATARAAASHLSEKGTDELAWSVGALFALAVCVVGVASDLARAAAVRHDARALAALRTGLTALARAPVRVLSSYTWRTLAALVPLVISALLSAHVIRGGTEALVVFAVFHQVVVVSRLAIRMSWTAKTLRAVTRGRAEGSS